MFTVLIASYDHIDAIQQRNKLFFEPFLESKELALCPWDPAGQTLQEAVPGLLDAVGRCKSWRAVIINNCTIKDSKDRNPYDVVDTSAIKALTMPSDRPGEGQSLEDWEASWRDYYAKLSEEKEAVYRDAISRPLQKLATWLCFRPEDYIHNEVHEKQDVVDWAMEMIGRDDVKPSGRLEQLERDQYKRELRMKESIRREFLGEKYLNVAYPSEVYCISPRSAENNYFDPDAYWNTRQDTEYSAFADRNMFFDRMRFMVFDMLSHTHRNFRSDYIRFLATIMIFVSHPIPGSAMQARRLYELEVDTDDAPLCTLVTSYDRKLAATAEVINNEMDKIRSEIPGELTDKAAEELFCTPRDVAVLLDDSCDPSKVLAEKDYGLFFDSPEDELHKWNRDHRTSEKALAYIAKQQARAIRRGVTNTSLAGETSNVDVSRLTPLQLEDIREYTEAAEDEMIASIPPDLSDISRYTKRLEKEAEKVKKVINQRMTRKTTIILSAVCLGLYFLCYTPFLFSNVGTPRTVTTAVVLSGVMLLLLAVVMFVSLLFLRAGVVNAVKNHNDTALQILNEIRSSMKRVSRYLSASSNVRRGHAVQERAKKDLNEYTKGLRIRKRHLEEIRRTRAFLAESYGDFMGDRSFCDETMSRPYEYDFDQNTDYSYPAPFLAGDCRLIEFISGGNLVTVPSSYVRKIMVRMEGIYEK